MSLKPWTSIKDY